MTSSSGSIKCGESVDQIERQFVIESALQGTKDWYTRVHNATWESNLHDTAALDMDVDGGVVGQELGQRRCSMGHRGRSLVTS